jgi:hypothetical protein
MCIARIVVLVNIPKLARWAAEMRNASSIQIAHAQTMTRAALYVDGGDLSRLATVKIRLQGPDGQESPGTIVRYET